MNLTTPALFNAFPDPEAMSQASEEEVFARISSISYPNAKSRYLIGLSRRLVDEFDSVVPATIEELVTLPGVGRKTAQVVISHIYDVPAFAVDTHCGRLARRLGWSHHADPDKVEADLKALLPQESWIDVHQQLVHHGRAICKARTPLCGECPLNQLCPSSTVP